MILGTALVALAVGLALGYAVHDMVTPVDPLSLHVATDPRCHYHVPPVTKRDRRRYERGRGIDCPVCTPQPVDNVPIAPVVVDGHTVGVVRARSLAEARAEADRIAATMARRGAYGGRS